MDEDLLNKKIGNKEPKSLEAKPVVALSLFSEPVKGREGGKNAGKEVGKKLVISVKHPDKTEPINISSCVSIVGKSLKNSTMWIGYDEDGDIQKGSYPALLMQKYGVSSLKELEGKTLLTELDENKFLTIRAY